jgi:tetratricopeptide (TPR) repeat protein
MWSRLGATVATIIALSAGTSARGDDLLNKLDAASKLAADGKCDLSAWRALVSDKKFHTLPGQMRSLSLTLLAVCGEEKPTDLLRRATQISDAPSFAWVTRFADAASRNDDEDALRSLERAADLAQDAPLGIDDDAAVFKTERRLRVAPAAHRRFFAALDRGRWTPTYVFETPQWLWLRYVNLLLADGDLAGARRIAARLTRPEILQRMRLDKRYDALLAADPGHFDVRYAALATLASDQALLAANPNDGGGIDIVARDLRILGRAADVLPMVDAALAQPGPLLKRETDYRTWMLNDRADALYDLGDFEGSVEFLKKAAAPGPGGAVTVSQAINLAGVLNAVGRPDEAVSTLAPFDTPEAKAATSPYGLMWVAAERACAYYALNQVDKAEASRAFTRDHATDNQGAVIKAGVCANDLDYVAATFIQRLETADGRAEALFQLSDFRMAKLTQVDVVMAARMQTLKARPDVRAAVSKAGRTETIDLIGAAMIDLY